MNFLIPSDVRVHRIIQHLHTSPLFLHTHAHTHTFLSPFCSAEPVSSDFLTGQKLFVDLVRLNCAKRIQHLNVGRFRRQCVCRAGLSKQMIQSDLINYAINIGNINTIYEDYYFMLCMVFIQI